MQLKIKRSQKESGMMSKTVVFCLDALVDLNDAELADIKRYKLGSLVLYSNEKHTKLAQALSGPMQLPGGGTATQVLGGAAAMMLSPYRMIAAGALQHLNLNITLESLQRGQHIECKSLDEVMGAETALTESCQNLKAYLGTAKTFDGREAVIDFDDPRVANA